MYKNNNIIMHCKYQFFQYVHDNFTNNLDNYKKCIDYCESYQQ